MGEVWPTTHITELCLQLTAGLKASKWRWAPSPRVTELWESAVDYGWFTFTFLPYSPKLVTHFYTPQLYRQVLLRRVLAMGILSVRPSVCHDPVRFQGQVRWRLWVFTIW